MTRAGPLSGRPVRVRRHRHDVLPARVQTAATLTRMVGLNDRVAYCQSDATRLPFAAHQFAQSWMAGLGIAMVFRFAITLEVQQGVLRALPITDVQAERDLCLIWRHDSRLPAAASAFLEVLPTAAPCGKARET